MATLNKRLAELGGELDAIYQSQNLREVLGSYTPEVDKVERQDQGAVPLLPPQVADWPNATLDDEICYIHVLRMLAAALDVPFLAKVNDTLKGLIKRIQPNGAPPLDTIKGYERMYNKLMSDYRRKRKPRGAQNIDMNRCLAVVKDPATLIKVLDALQKAFGAFAKWKNGMALDDKEAAEQFHLRLCMASVVFEHPRLKTFGEVCKDEQAIKLLDEYAAQEPPPTVAYGVWKRQIARGRAMFESPAIADRKVAMVCEVQCLMTPYKKVRSKMHEVYKVARADTAVQLQADFAKYEIERERKKKFEKDGDTELKKAARDINSEAGRDAKEEELAGRLDLTSQKLAFLRGCESMTTSMDATVRVSGKGSSAGTGGSGSETKVADGISDPAALPDERAEASSLQSDIHGLLRTSLSDRECDVVRLRFGLDDGRARTLEEIGTVFRITRERVRQIEARALHKLRQPYRNHLLEAYTTGGQP